MSRILGFMLGAVVILGLRPGGQGPGGRLLAAGEWSHGNRARRSIPLPGLSAASISRHSRRSTGLSANAPSYPAQQYVPYGTQTRPAQAREGSRSRRLVGARVYNRGYNQAPAPYATQLPRGQLAWPGSAMAPGYTPFSRYRSYGSGYGVSPYGSNFWGGYYKGFPMIGD